MEELAEATSQTLTPMITKREVTEVIAACESLTGFGPLDRAPVQIERGQLAVLIEAARVATYRNIARPYAQPDLILDDGEDAIRHG